MAETKNANCPSREELLAFSVARVSEAALETIAAHLQACDGCVSTLATLHDTDDSLLQGLRAPSSAEPFLDEPEYAEIIEKLEAIGCGLPSSDRPDHASIGTLPSELGRYRVLEELGRGGMGTVYLAHDTQLDRQVALKIPDFKPNENPLLLERFYREARAAATIEHPNLCPVHDVGEIEGLPYLSMAHIKGKSLSKLIKARGQLPEREAAQLVRKIAVAVEEAHRHGVVHRDIKPSNIMITDEGEPILTDFGLARRIEMGDTRRTHSGLIVGTPRYMAPEQVDGDLEAMGPRCDVYSLGVVLYELLTGEVPFRGPLLSVLSQLGQDQPDPPSKHNAEVNRRLEAICLKAMAKASQDRYRSAEELAEALEHYAEDPSQATSPPSRRRWLALGSAAGAAALLLLSVVTYVKTGDGTLVLEVSQPDVKVTIDGNQVQIKSPRDEISVVVGRHELEVSKDNSHRLDFDPAGAAPGDVLAVFRDPHPQPGDWFGTSIAVLNDKVFIGASGDDNAAGTNAGAVFVFDLQDKGLPLYELHGERASTGFGHSVVVIGKVVAVGAPDIDGHAGAAYLYDAQTAERRTKIPNPEPGSGDTFGSCIAPLGDDFLIAAERDESERGSVYLYDPSGKQLHRFEPPRQGPIDFGKWVVAVDGKVAVGAQRATAVYVFESAPPYGLLATIAGSGGYLGRSVEALGGALLVCDFNRSTDLWDLSGERPTCFHTYPEGGDVCAIGDNVLIRGCGSGTLHLFDGNAPYDKLLTISPVPCGNGMAALRSDLLVGVRRAQ